MPNIQLQFRRGTAQRWGAFNPVLAAGEMGIESDTNQFKIGDGVTSWSNLPYGGIQGPAGMPGATVAFLFDGGGPSANYSFGPAFDCGGVS
jgi:Major tropism determinant N-terminal domain